MSTMTSLDRVFTAPLTCGLLDPYSVKGRWRFRFDSIAIPRLYISYSEIYQQLTVAVATACCNAETYLVETDYRPKQICVDCRESVSPKPPSVSYFADLKPWLDSRIHDSLNLNPLERAVVLDALTDRIDAVSYELGTLVNKALRGTSTDVNDLPHRLRLIAKRESRPLGHE